MRENLYHNITEHDSTDHRRENVVTTPPLKQSVGAVRNAV